MSLIPPATTPPRGLPTAIVTYLERSVGPRPQSAALTFVDDAVVVDDGKTYTGEAAIAAWLTSTATALELTTTQLRVDRDDASTTVVNRIEGNFPGRSVDLTYRFELHAETGLIQKLTITL
ncbi:MAG: hypothetical protein R6W83_02870 [Cryobacterium sp.]